jgi:hypothetical protein
MDVYRKYMPIDVNNEGLLTFPPVIKIYTITAIIIITIFSSNEEYTLRINALMLLDFNPFICIKNPERLRIHKTAFAINKKGISKPFSCKKDLKINTTTLIKTNNTITGTYFFCIILHFFFAVSLMIFKIIPVITSKGSSHTSKGIEMCSHLSAFKPIKTHSPILTKNCIARPA